MKKTYLLAASLMLMLFSACETTEVVYDPQDNPVIPEFPAPTAEQFINLQNSALDNITQNFSFNADNPMTTFVSQKGVELVFYGGCLTKNGVPVTGNVDLEYVEIFNRGSMLVTNKATMAASSGGSQRLLISGGEFYINVTQNGEQLATDCGVYLYVPAYLTGGLDTDMQAFTGTVDSEGNIVWGVQETEFWAGGEQEATPIYYALVQSFGWFNCDKFASFDGPLTDIEVLVPQGYNLQNSNIYIALPGVPNTLGNLYGQYPVGLECYIIFVTGTQDGNYAYAIKTVTLSENASYTFTIDEFQDIDEAGFIALINALP